MKIFDSPNLNLWLNEDEKQNYLELNVKGEGYCIWPNREGEGFSLNAVYPVLDREHCLETGLTLSWPATAGALALALFPPEGEGILFQIDSPEEGCHIELSIKSESESRLIFRFTGLRDKPVQWKIRSLSKRKPESSLKSLKFLPKQFQAGLIGPGNECYMKKEGFAGLVSLGEKIQEAFPEETAAPVLHLFGYAAGHDRAYPDYSPSAGLGGPSSLRAAVLKLKSMGFRLSFYMNARLMETDQLNRFPGLAEGICQDARGERLVEEYFGRSFFVMNPLFTPWTEELFQQAQNLQALGADLIQLDQVAGRAAAVPPGEIWGQGYNNLIQRLHGTGLEVWIQGVSDYYRADCFEMTWRDIKILPGGILRGGNPFGRTDLGLLKALALKGQLLAPLSRLESIGTSGFDFRIDMMGDQGRIPLVGPGYITELQKKSLYFKNL